MTWPAIVPNRMETRALLVGTATQVTPSDLPQMPVAAAAVTDLTAALTGTAGLFHPSGVHTVLDPQTREAVLDPLSTLCGTDDRLDLVLFYFAGHGLHRTGNKLALALTGSVDKDDEAARTGLPVEDVLAMLQNAHARYRVAVLDCCFSGRALDCGSVDGVHLLTATDSTHKALYPEHGRTTGFTAALLRLLNDGVPDGPEFLSLATVYQQLAVMLPSSLCPSPTAPDRRFPAPRQRTVDDSGDLALGRNHAHGTATSSAGLDTRARFAHRTLSLGYASLAEPYGRTERFRQAAHLFAGIAADAARQYGRTEAATVRLRLNHATAVGLSGAAADAVTLLDRLLTDLSHAPADSTLTTEAHAARTYWAARLANH